MSNIIWVLILRIMVAGIEAPVEEFDTKGKCINKANYVTSGTAGRYIAAYCKAKTEEAR